ncbi:hypothetical protein [Onishia taeanensis]|uniref:hypothetical protein n=1 Tax=Onishia taeanensis TaxID=284577 RepID=UPI003C7EAA69
MAQLVVQGLLAVMPVPLAWDWALAVMAAKVSVARVAMPMPAAVTATMAAMQLGWAQAWVSVQAVTLNPKPALALWRVVLPQATTMKICLAAPRPAGLTTVLPLVRQPAMLVPVTVPALDLAQVPVLVGPAVTALLQLPLLAVVVQATAAAAAAVLVLAEPQRLLPVTVELVVPAALAERLC